MNIFHAGVAQLAEQLICNQQVAGSSPITGLQTRTPEMAFFLLYSQFDPVCIKKVLIGRQMLDE